MATSDKAIDLLERAADKLQDYSAEVNDGMNDSLAMEIRAWLESVKGREEKDIVRLYHIIAPNDVGRWSIKVGNRIHLVSGFMGRILPRDIGKRIFSVNDILQVENDEQFESRLAREGRSQ